MQALLLDDSMATVLAAWAQVGLGIGTLIVGICTAFTQRRLEEVVELTKEHKAQTAQMIKQTTQLIEQTKILESQYQLERTSSLRRRIAIFTTQTRSVQNRLELLNDGVITSRITIENKIGDHYDVQLATNEVQPGGEIICNYHW